jgi:hypothetical protein
LKAGKIMTITRYISESEPLRLLGSPPENEKYTAVEIELTGDEIEAIYRFCHNEYLEKDVSSYIDEQEKIAAEYSGDLFVRPSEEQFCEIVNI